MCRSNCRVFIGSSSEGIQYAEGLFSELEQTSQPVLWDQDVFSPTHHLLNDLDNTSEKFDHAAFILSPDDLRKSRGETSSVPRDNVIFELGLFVGSLGRDRVFLLVPGDKDISLPTDLAGITYLEYYPRADNNVRASVRTAATRIKRNMSSARSTSSAVSYWDNISMRRKAGEDPPSLINRSSERVLITGIALNFIAKHCKPEIESALRRGTAIGILLADNSDLSKRIYYRYSSSSDPSIPSMRESRNKFCSFKRSLSKDLSSRLGIYRSNIPMMNSIGLYDDILSVSLFCMGGDSTASPSFQVGDEQSSLYRVFYDEAKELLLEADPILDSVKARKLEIF